MYKTRVLGKKMTNAIRQTVKSGGVVERMEKSGNIMQVFYSNGNILKRTYHMETEQWSNISVSKNQNWTGSFEWHVIQDENGKDLRFNGCSEYKVLPPFILRGCILNADKELPEAPETPKISEAPKAPSIQAPAVQVPAQEAEPKTQEETAPLDLVKNAATRLSEHFNIPLSTVLREMTDLKKEMGEGTLDDVIKEYVKQKDSEKVPESTGCIQEPGAIIELLRGRTMRHGQTLYKVTANVLYECQEGDAAFVKSTASFNQVMNCKLEADTYNLSFKDAVKEMKKGAQCIPSGWNVRFKMNGANILRVDGVQGFPVAAIDQKWRVYKE